MGLGGDQSFYSRACLLPINLGPHPWCRWLVSSRAFHDCRHEGGEAEDQSHLGYWSVSQISKPHPHAS